MGIVFYIYDMYDAWDVYIQPLLSGDAWSKTQAFAANGVLLGNSRWCYLQLYFMVCFDCAVMVFVALQHPSDKRSRTRRDCSRYTTKLACFTSICRVLFTASPCVSDFGIWEKHGVESTTLNTGSLHPLNFCPSHILFTWHRTAKFRAN